MAKNACNTADRPAPPNTIEFVSGELFVFGKQIRTHQEMPWLFCATDLHKACEFFIRRAAAKKNKNPDSSFKSKRPAAWVQWNLNDDDTYESVALITRQRIKERGAYLGLKTTNNKSNARYLALLDTLSDRELILYSSKGGAPGTAGTYLCLHALVQYAAFMNKMLHTKIIQCYLDIITGDVDRVTDSVVYASVRAKGTATRAENKQLTYELSEECAKKKLLPIKPQQGINEGTLGMTGAKYKKLYGVPEPLNDNLTVAQVRVKNMSMIIATKDISDHADDKISPEDGVKIGRLAALQSRVVLSGRLKDRILKEVALLEKEDKANEKRLTREFKAGKRPALPE